MRRRDFLAGLLASAGMLAAPGVFAQMRKRGRYLVLIELQGGNDGLNTVVPFFDENYYRLRPKLALPEKSVIKISEGLGLHPALSGMANLLQKERLMVVQGVGYPGASLDHQRAIAAWDTASAGGEPVAEGWLTKAFRVLSKENRDVVTADGFSVGVQEAGPFRQSGRHLVLLDRYSQPYAGEHALRLPGEPQAERLRRSAEEISRAIGAKRLVGAYPAGEFGIVMSEAARLIIGCESGILDGLPVIRVRLGSFDTHKDQLPKHAALLRQLSEGIVAFMKDMEALGLLDRVMVMAYSEFGRCPKENASGGTDHGTAGPLFMVGDGIHAGLHGEPSNLAKLDSQGNPQFGIDFRSVYCGLLAEWFAVDSRPVTGDIKRLGIRRYSLAMPKNVA